MNDVTNQESANEQAERPASAYDFMALFLILPGVVSLVAGLVTGGDFLLTFGSGTVLYALLLLCGTARRKRTARQPEES